MASDLVVQPGEELLWICGNNKLVPVIVVGWNVPHTRIKFYVKTDNGGVGRVLSTRPHRLKKPETHPKNLQETVEACQREGVPED